MKREINQRNIHSVVSTATNLCMQDIIKILSSTPEQALTINISWTPKNNYTLVAVYPFLPPIEENF